MQIALHGLRLAAFTMAIGILPASSSEFGNVFGSPQVEQASRSASARALEGLERVFATLRLRELEGPGVSSATLRDAIARLRSAATAMEAIHSSVTGDVRLDRLSPAERRFVEQAFSQLQFPLPKTQAELYRQFQNATQGFASYLEKFINDSDRPLLPMIVGPLTNYIKFGDAVTELARTSL